MQQGGVVVLVYGAERALFCFREDTDCPGYGSFTPPAVSPVQLGGAARSRGRHVLRLRAVSPRPQASDPGTLWGCPTSALLIQGPRTLRLQCHACRRYDDEDLSVFSFELTEAEMAELTALNLLTEPTRPGTSA
jgi:hypothetical protein